MSFFSLPKCHSGPFMLQDTIHGNNNHGNRQYSPDAVPNRDSRFSVTPAGHQWTKIYYSRTGGPNSVILGFYTFSPSDQMMPGH